MVSDSTVVQQILHQAPPARPIGLSVKLSLHHSLGIRQAVRDLHTLTQWSPVRHVTLRQHDVFVACQIAFFSETPKVQK